MDLDTRTYLKKMIEDAGRAQLIMSVLQRFAAQMSEAEIEVLQASYLAYMEDAKDYLGINNEGKLVVTDPEELKRLGLELQPEALPEEDEAESEDPEPEPAPVSEPQSKGSGKKKKDGYT
jgi:hypothetical protein